MASWAALNAASAPRAALEEARDGATAEAQDAQNAALYGRALRLQQQQKVSEASAVYTELLETASGLSSRLRYLCAKNLATLEAERRAFEPALQRYTEALALDDTDAVVWYHMGKAALATGQLWLARQAFEAGFQLDATFWPIAHALCDVLHAVGDGAAYQRVAAYVLEHDPGAGRVGGTLREMDGRVDPAFRVCESPLVAPSRSASSLKRPTPALEASDSAAKRRKALADATCQHEQNAARRAPLRYLLQQRSWLSLGKLLLEAYDDVTSEKDLNGSISMRPVHVSAEFVDEPPEPEPMTVEANTEVAPVTNEERVAETPIDVVDLVGDEEEETADGTAAEPIEVDGGEDGDQDDAGGNVQTNRRKSRRHEEKLREEHELAAKLAREKNLAYRLQAYVPNILSDDRESEYYAVLFRINGDSVVLERANGDTVHTFESVLPSAPANETAESDEPNKEEDTVNTGSLCKTVDQEHLSNFLERTMNSTDGVDIVRLLQAYLNECGGRSDQALVPPSQNQDQTLHSVCLWAEKVVRGRLGVAPSTPGRASDKIVRSRVGMNRHSEDGLTAETRLFLLELHLDDVVYNHTQHGQSRPRKAMRSYYAQLDDILRVAQALLLDICWHANEDGALDIDEKKTTRLLVRLFWLCGSASEQRGNISAAREYLSKCKESLEELEEGSLIQLPNLRSPATISVSTADQKITDLQFSNVCTEVQEMTTTSRFDEAQGKLLAHFFPADGQVSRINDLLDDFSASKQREQDRTDGGDDADVNDSSLLELLLESVANSTVSQVSEKILILLVILAKLAEVVECRLQKVRQKTADTERHTLRVAIHAIEVTVDRLAAVIASASDATDSLCSNTKRAVMAVVTVLLEPKILLLFDGPRNVLQVIHDMADQLTTVETETLSEDSMDTSKQDVFGPLMVSAANSFHKIRSLSLPERERMLTTLAAPLSSSKSKKKQPIRHDRVRLYVQTVLGLLTGHVQILAALLPGHQVRALMEDCCVLLKEEEEMTRRHHDGDKTAKKTLAVGATIFVQLVVAVSSKDADKVSSLKRVVGLVRLLHDRLGEHELCSLDCFDKSIGSGNCVGKTFVQVAASILQDFHTVHKSIQLARRRLKSLTRKNDRQNETSDAKSDVEASADEDNATGDSEEEEEGFDHVLGQCYRCLYDAHIVPGCIDHKTGASIADLESVPATTSLQLADFALPIMLKRPPRSNAQKKENMKILVALERAANLVRDGNQLPEAPPQLLLQYLSPTSLLSWNEDLPISMLESSRPVAADSSFDDIWYLLGENFILHRVRKRSNLNELIEMERKIKERIAYLLKDVQYYRPRRMQSWTRLGRSTKELYQVASDACALVLGRKWRKRILLPAHVLPNMNAIDGSFNARESPSFQDVVLNSSLFEMMKVWHDIDDESRKLAHRVCFQKAQIGVVSIESDLAAVPPEYSIEEIAELYLSQVVEFSRRCFMMAAAIATHQKSDVEETNPPPERDDDPIESLQAAVDAYEDCGLLMYNQLRELAVLRRDEDIVSSKVFPMTSYNEILDCTLRCFQDGLLLSSNNNPEAHDVRFRLHYMIGKVLKKRLALQRLGSDDQSECSNSTTPEDVMKCFANAEDEHERGKMDKSIVHAFYQLQAMRLLLVLVEPVSIDSLRLACDHYFEEVDDEDDEDEDEEMEGDEKADDEPATSEKVTKEDVAALLKTSELESSKGHFHLAQGWLFFNLIDALESISDEDRYFHASRYALTRAMYLFNDVIERLSSIGDDVSLPSPSTSAKNCIAALVDKKTKKKNDGNTSVEIALKEMHPLFDKKRPQVVAVWLTEHVPTSKKFEELNQRQIKFDFCRIKYFSYFVRLLQENEAYGRLKEVGSWVLACKEEHDAIDEMLGIVLHARGSVQLSRLREFVCTELADQLERSQQEMNETQIESAEGFRDQASAAKDATESASELLLKELSKAYVNYLDVAHSSARLAKVMPTQVLQETTSLVEFPIVYLYLIGVTEFPSIFEVLERDEVLTAASIAATTFKLRAVLLNDPSTLAVKACVSVDWKPLFVAARSFCEDRWPERHSGKAASSGKHTKKARQAKPAPSTPAPPIQTLPTIMAVSSLLAEEDESLASGEQLLPPDPASASTTTRLVDTLQPSEI